MCRYAKDVFCPCYQYTVTIAQKQGRSIQKGNTKQKKLPSQGRTLR